MLLTKFRFIWPIGFRGEELTKIDQSETRIAWWPCLLTDHAEMRNLYRGTSNDASYQISVHLTKWLQRRRIYK
jgi:hypothetical protein